MNVAGAGVAELVFDAFVMAGELAEIFWVFAGAFLDLFEAAVDRGGATFQVKGHVPGGFAFHAVEAENLRGFWFEGALFIELIN